MYSVVEDIDPAHLRRLAAVLDLSESEKQRMAAAYYFEWDFSA